MQLEVGMILEGKVTGITKFGAFVALTGANKSGLVQINLSIKKAVEAPPAEARPQRRAEDRPRPAAPAQAAPRQSSYTPREVYQPQKSADQSFEDKLKQFMQESDSRMSGNKLYADRKGSNRRRK